MRAGWWVWVQTPKARREGCASSFQSAGKKLGCEVSAVTRDGGKHCCENTAWAGGFGERESFAFLLRNFIVCAGTLESSAAGWVGAAPEDSEVEEELGGSRFRAMGWGFPVDSLWMVKGPLGTTLERRLGAGQGTGCAFPLKLQSQRSSRTCGASYSLCALPRLESPDGQNCVPEPPRAPCDIDPMLSPASSAPSPSHQRSAGLTSHSGPALLVREQPSGERQHPGVAPGLRDGFGVAALCGRASGWQRDSAFPTSSGAKPWPAASAREIASDGKY